jgi:hypothetical protein
MNPAPASLTTLKLIVTGLVVGACAFGGAIAFGAQKIGGRIVAAPAVNYCAYLLAAAALGLSLFVLPRVLTQPPASLGEAAILNRFGSMLLLRVGLLEGAYIFCIVIYLLTQDDYLLGAGVVLILGMLILRPTDDGYRRWRDGLT